MSAKRNSRVLLFCVAAEFFSIANPHFNADLLSGILPASSISEGRGALQ